MEKSQARTSQAGDETDVEAQLPPPAPTAKAESLNTTFVDWEGPNDPQNPFNWPTWRKTVQIGLMTFNTFITPLASSMLTPGVANILREFHSSSDIISSFLVSVYLLGYLYGRVPVYHACNAVLLIFTIACAVAQTLPQLMVFRFLAGVAGVCPLTIGAGTVADMVYREQRAGVMALWSMGPYMGPVIGPIAGGFLVEATNWRWVFWVLSITIGVVLVATVLCYRESYAPVLLTRKAARLRKETGDSNIRSKFENDERSPRRIFMAALARPIKLLFTSPIVFLMALFAAITYGYLYLMFTTMTPIFEGIYGFSQGIAGLAYIGFGVGCLSGAAVIGPIANRIAASHTARGCFSPESRLLPMMYGCWALPIGLFWYGWSAQAHTHWIMPIIGTAIFGVGLVAVFSCVSAYLVESYLVYAASVTAANTCFRSLVGALLPLAGHRMYATLGLGWGEFASGFYRAGYV
ncbi:MFS general substrate transporter [Penicillium chermesinum]|nr:MFS general substrate transporter [Penicillium chermesinum]